MTQPAEGPGEQPLSPQDSLTLITTEQAAKARRGNLDAALYTGIWGFAFLISWGAFYLVGEHHLPGFVAGILLGVLVPTSAVISTVLGIRSSRGVRGPSQVMGAMYGWSWTLGFMALTAINVGLQDTGLNNNQVNLLWSGSALLLMGVLYLAAGTVFRSWPQYAFGAWMLISAAGSVYAGVPKNFLVLALAGGGGFLVQAAYYAWRGFRGAGPDCAGTGASVPAL
ncbi:MAG TPA: hypothetical protein VGN81_21475 [Pseudonocardiaceae bacterium]|jgi:hypothetical protein